MCQYTNKQTNKQISKWNKNVILNIILAVLSLVDFYVEIKYKIFSQKNMNSYANTCKIMQVYLKNLS